MKFLGSFQRGNAILISLIIMASTLTISLGIAALVGSEIKTTGLLVPSERAYYKAESFVEQALWNKTKGDAAQGYGPNYQAPSKDDSDGGSRPAVKDQAYVCTTAPCFTVDPRSTNDTLKRFSATTQPPSNTITLPQDEPQQLEVGSATQSVRPIIEVTDAKVATVPNGVTNQNPAANYAGLEVTIIATPKTTACNNYQGTVLSRSVGPTCTFVDKQRIGKNETGKTFNLTTTNATNAVGESAPNMDTYNYRLRVRALGADASAKIKVRLPDGTNLTLRTPDFTALAVAEDTRAQRGVQVVVPDVPEVLNIFDYVLFADADLEKLAKKPDDAQNQAINVTVQNDINCNGTVDAGETNAVGVSVDLTGGPNQATSANTGADGVARFLQQYTGSYTARVVAQDDYVLCPTGSNQSITLTSGQTANATLRVRTKRVPLHEYYSSSGIDHFYTITRNDLGLSYFGYAYESIYGYVYPTQVPGTLPFYRLLYGAPYYDHFYTTDNALATYYTYGGWLREGNEGYLGAYTGPQRRRTGPANPYNGTCQNGSIPFYNSYHGPTPTDPYYDNFYTTSYINGAFGYTYQRISGCIWTTE